MQDYLYACFDRMLFVTIRVAKRPNYSPDVALSALLTAVLLWPARAGGYLLGRDMVFTPQQPLNAAALGVSGAPPRAVPADALVALAEFALGGQVVSRIAVIVPMLAVGIGVGRLLAAMSTPARLAAVAVAIWNPFVIERLAMGQWSLLWGYAALPWVVRAAIKVGNGGSLLGLIGAVAVASIVPTTGLVAAVTAFVVVACGSTRPTRSHSITLVGAVLCLQLPWILPAITASTMTSDPGAASVFAAEAERPGGVLLSLLGLGGSWNDEVVPASRAGVLGWLTVLGVVLVVVCGAKPAVAYLGRRTVIGLAGVSVGGLLIAGLGSIPGGAALLRWAIEFVPGAGLLRDGQKWILPFVLAIAVLSGAAVQRVVEGVRRTFDGQRLLWGAVVGVIGIALPIALLPDAAATVRPVVSPVSYPADWKRVSDLVGGRGLVVVIPWSAYRSFSWAPGRPVLDPANRYLQAPMIVNDVLYVDQTRVDGEDPRVAVVQKILDEDVQIADRLANLGVRWVVIESGTPGSVPAAIAAGNGFTQAYQGSQLRLMSVDPPVTSEKVDMTRLAIVIAGNLLASIVLLGSAATVLARRVRSCTHRTSN